jgi:hypothetical protein
VIYFVDEEDQVHQKAVTQMAQGSI